ncbi:MAG: Aspartate carbamoyltransferase regulatory chain [Candidatus Magasanikbacteria bacterium GW2011_GWC2_41_17]|uniref:Aspartate carbamoyltransferase regulatory chain n=2 Tax=Candidatus Magasanikiibacteriota TaxID=1752731 RepID=A0A0G0ZJK0_9BACT|nr:MAG: Aspartate carbamoyltransferase regulatory chain [Candidatus Magasanikbacteria bacterium GW2011_GWC2_41_17]KKS13118.1 MAG: Aspartate carbamoyltransferase regulatory chain [Candidatus Magasanikbacteria bacterium GW2011_GWA2_41_55]
MRRQCDFLKRGLFEPGRGQSINPWLVGRVRWPERPGELSEQRKLLAEHATIHMTQDKKLLVSAIKNGTVIDHINAGQALKIIRFLNLAAQNKLVTVGLNLPSKLMKIKDLIKVEDWEISLEEANQVALIAPQSTINIIKNYTVTKKFALKLPEKIEHLLVCPNPKCITNHEPMDSFFYVKLRKQKVEVSCKYCEKQFALDEIKDYKI